MDIEFYEDALSLLAESDHFELILDHEDGQRIESTRLLWYVSLALDKGNIPLVAYFNPDLNMYVAISNYNDNILYMSKDTI